MKHHARILRHIQQYMDRVSGRHGEASLRMWATFVDDKGRRRVRFIERDGETIDDPGTAMLPKGGHALSYHAAVDYVVRRIERRYATLR